jgi:hypothetical protein
VNYQIGRNSGRFYEFPGALPTPLLPSAAVARLMAFVGLFLK